MFVCVYIYIYIYIIRLEDQILLNRIFSSGMGAL